MLMNIVAQQTKGLGVKGLPTVDLGINLSLFISGLL